MPGRSAIDTRVKQVELTASGHRLLAHIDLHVRHAPAGMRGALCPAERARFVALLHRLVDTRNSHERASMLL